MTRILTLIFLLIPSLSIALESPQADEASCNQWKSSVTGWLQSNHVKLVGDDKEAIVICDKNAKDRWTGRIASRVTTERASQIAAIEKYLDCAPPTKQAPLQRGVASEATRLDTPCKIAANDLKLFQQEIQKPQMKTSGYMCCGGQIANRWVSCTAGALFDKSCKLSCQPCLGITPPTPAWSH